MYASDIIQRNRNRVMYASKVAWKTFMDANSTRNGPYYIPTVKDSTRVEQADLGSLTLPSPFSPTAPVAIGIAMSWYSIVCTFSTYDRSVAQYSIPSTTTLILRDLTTQQTVASINVTGLSSYTFSLPQLFQGHEYSYTLVTTNSYGSTSSQPSASLLYLVYMVSTYIDYSSGGPCPYAIASKPDGTLYYIDYFNYPASLIYTVSPGGVITTVGSTAISAGTSGIAVSSSQHIYFADTENSRIFMWNSSTGTTQLVAGSLTGATGYVNGNGSAARFHHPYGLAIDSIDNIYVADLDNSVIRMITPAGVVSTFAGNGMNGYVDGPVGSAEFASPSGVAVSPTGTVYIADSGNNRVRAISGGIVTTLAGSGAIGNVNGQGTAAVLNYPTGITLDSNGSLYVTCLDNTVRLITPDGYCVTIAGMEGVAGSINGQGNAATFDYPQGITVDATGKLYVADFINCMIRAITPP